MEENPSLIEVDTKIKLSRVMTYASRYTQRTTPAPSTFAEEPKKKRSITPSRTAPPSRLNESAVRGGSWVPPTNAASVVRRTPSNVALRQPDRGKVRDAMSVNALSEKLKGLQQLREQMELLAARHKEQERELEMLVRGVQANRPSAQSNLQEVSSLQRTLSETIEERDKALSMLEVFRSEGNQVIQRMHAALREAHDQQHNLSSRVDILQQDNQRLRRIVREVEYDVVQNSSTLGEQDYSQLALAKQTIVKLDELLQEADAVIVNVRSQNEDLIHQNDQFLQRERGSEGRQMLPSDASSTAIGDTVDEILADDGDIRNAIVRLTNQLRHEKMQRMEAEELSHKLLIEHQKNVALLEQRLHRPGAQTPRSVGTPRITTTPAAIPQKEQTPTMEERTVGAKDEIENRSSEDLENEIDLLMAAAGVDKPTAWASAADNGAMNNDEDTLELHKIQEELDAVAASLVADQSP